MHAYTGHCNWCKKTAEKLYPDKPPDDCIPDGWIGLRGSAWGEFCSRNCLVAHLLGRV